MKKSTLITTIAMIVVVVVALSTATYAWFTGGTATQVTDTISTSTASGWYLYGATLGTPSVESGHEGERSVVFSGTAPLALHLLNTGLFSPVAALQSTFTCSDLTGSYKDTQFFAAEQRGFGIVETATVTSAPAYDHVLPGTDPVQTADNLNAIRIVNNNEGASDCHLTILVNLGTNPATTEYVAGKKFRTYIVKAGGGVFNTAYYYGSAAAVGSESTIGNSGSPVGASESTNALTYSTDTNSKTILNGTQPSSGYSVSTAGQKFGDTDLETGSNYYTIDINLGNVQPYEAINLVFYAWFDGWATDNTAAGSSISVVFSVGGTATTVATPEQG